MPAVSKNQRKAMAIAEHSPGKLNADNAGMKNMSIGQLHDFASTPEKGLPAKKAKKRGTVPFNRNKNQNSQGAI